MRVLNSAVVCLLASLSAGVAVANSQSTTLYQYKDWAVRLVRYDDGKSSCVAEVTYDDGEAFSLWEDRSGKLSLQFYNPDWDFGEKDSYDAIVIQIDSRSGWRVKDADFYKNSVFVDPPNDNATRQFVSEVKFGQTLYLSDGNGKRQKSYSLAGSQATIEALVSCMGRL